MIKVNLKNRHPALLIVDVQELFSSPDGPFENTTAGEMVECINALTAECERLKLPIIYSRYLFRDDLSDAGLLSDNPMVQQGDFCESSPWMMLDKRLKVPESSIQLKRGRPGAFWGGELLKTLSQNNIDTLLLCGLSVNNAISTTAREAFAHDFPTIVIKEATGAAPWETEIETYFEILNTWTAEVVSTDEVIKRVNSI